MLCANNTMHLLWSWMPVYTLEYFWKHSEYSEVVWWLLVLLDKMITEGGAQGFKFPAQRLKASVFGLQGTWISCNPGVETAEN